MNITINALEAYLHHHYGEHGNEQSLFMKLVEETGEVYSGAYLMNAGLNFTHRPQGDGLSFRVHLLAK